MKTSIIYPVLFILIFLFTSTTIDYYTIIKCKYSNGDEAKIGRVEDDMGREAFCIAPNNNPAYSNNLSLFTYDGALVIGESGPCLLENLVTNSSQETMLYLVRGVGVQSTGMWAEEQSSSFRTVTESLNNSHSIDILRALNLYEYEGGKIGINPDEVRSVLPSSVGEFMKNGELITTFNGSQTFYHLIGSIRYLDEKKGELEAELAIKQTEVDALNSEVNRLKTTNGQLLHQFDTIETRLAELEKNFISVPEIE